jgi:hypothetical protein
LTQQQNTDVQETTTVSAPTTQQVVRRTKVVTPQAGTGSPQKEYQTKKAIFRTYQIIWYILGVIEVLLAFRILLKLMGANSQNGFTSFVYIMSNPFALPFAGILGVTDISEMTFEWSTLIAMAVYAIVAYGIIMLFQLIKPTNQEEVEQTVDNQ